MIRAMSLAAAALSLVVLGGAAWAGSAPPVIEVWQGAHQTFGQQGNPQRYINILGKVSDPDGVASLIYSLNGGSASPLSMGPDGRRLASPGDFNIDLSVSDLLGGTNQVVITAVDNAGATAMDTVTVEYLPGNVWPQPYTIDWSLVTSIQSVTQVVDGQWRLEGGELRTAVPGYDRLVAIGDTTWTDYEVRVPITIHSAAYQSGAGVGVLMRWTGHTDDPVAGFQPKAGWNPFGTIAWWRWPYSPAARLELYGTGTGVDFTPVPEVRYLLKARVETMADQSGRYSLKAWEAGQPEPAGWQVQATRNSLQRGSFLLIAHYADVSFGNLTVVPVSSPGPADTSPPTAPSGLVATAMSPSRIDLSWTAASDPESGVTSYKVYRNGVVVGTPTGMSFSDTGLSGWTSYTYQISAVNGAGMEGAKSASASATTPDGTPPTAPTNLRARAVSPSRIDLSWTAASDPESGVASYKVYRSGVVVGTPTDTTFSDTGLSAGTNYNYKVSAVNGAGLEGPKSTPANEKTPLLIPGVLKPVAAEGLFPKLEQNSPNPFNPTTAIHYTLPAASRVRLVVYDALGRQVRVLVDSEQEAGVQRAVWDGRDDSGRRVAAGLYLCRLEAGAYLAVRKMLLLQ